MLAFSMTDGDRWLLLLLLLLCPLHATAEPRWIAHASMPGPDLADSGVSRFDQLFRVGKDRYQIPYPFESLVEYLNSIIDKGDDSGARLVYIPIGRSLQRNAPAPDFFYFPRALVALQGEPKPTPDGTAEVLEYRLFITHQPKTESLEVISYNDDAGRFEFQVVDAYTAGREPVVSQANRIMCLSCHQNAAPIFPRIPWSETTFNVEIANKLIEALPRKFQSLIGTVTADAGAIDLMVERANYLAAAQLIWQQGCSSARCRAAMLKAVLQYRLSGKSSFDLNTQSYREHYAAELRRNWKLNWPDGLALANSRIDDRDPLADTSTSSRMDPLSMRAAHATWREVDSIVVRGIIYRLAGFLTGADIEQIDRHLIKSGRLQSVAVSKHEGICQLESRTESTALLICADETKASGLRARIELQLSHDEPDSIRILSLRAPGDPSLLQPDIIRLSVYSDGLKAELANPAGALSQRIANGDRVNSLNLRWPNSALQGDIRLDIEISAEFQLVEQALTKLLQEQNNGSADSLSAKAFRRQAILYELGEALGRKMDMPERLPALLSASAEYNADLQDDRVHRNQEGKLALLQPYCGRCHADNTINPPGFLAGRDAWEKIRQCAPRILARLKAWQAGSDFSKAPMPPPATLGALATTIDDWPVSDHYRALVASVETLIGDARHGPDHDYDSLPPCLRPD
jgi:hypothetical protein